jgi:hypothetical protein
MGKSSSKSQNSKKNKIKDKPKAAKLLGSKTPSKKTTGKSLDSSSQATCREPACEYLAIGSGFCRLHYIKYWHRIKRKEGILQDGGLRQYIEELTSKYSEKHIEAIRQDLMTDDGFVKVISELDLHESEDELVDMDSQNSIEEYPIENVRTEVDSPDDDY